MINFSSYWQNFVLNWFYKDHSQPEDPQERLSHNLFIFAVTLGVFLSFTFATMYIYNGFLGAGILQYIVCLICILCLFIFKKYKSVVLSGQIIFLVLFLTSWYRVHIFGGINAPTFYTYVLIPTFSLGFLPVRWAFFWTMAFLSIAVGYHIADNLGLVLSSSIPTGKEGTLRINGIIFANLVSFFVVLSIRKVHAAFQVLINKEKEEKTNMIRLISHDLSGPLMIMQHHLQKVQNEINANSGAAPLANSSLRDGDLKDNKVDSIKNSEQVNKVLNTSIEKALKAKKAIQTLVENVRQFEAIESGKIGFELRSVNLKQALENVEFIQEQNLISKNIKLNTVGNSNLSVLADPTALTFQILNNLISNAIKFSENDSQIDIVVLESKRHIILKIVDHGIGIPELIIKKLTQFNAATTRPGTNGEKGTGFGMPIVKTTVEKLGGEMKIESKVKTSEDDNSGTTVTLTFQKAG